MSASLFHQTAGHPHSSRGGFSFNVYEEVRVTHPEGSDILMGKVSIEVCSECPHLVVRCEHDQRHWVHRPDCDGTTDLSPMESSGKQIYPGECTGCLLQCDFCKADLT